MSTQDTRPLTERLREGCIFEKRRGEFDPIMVNEGVMNSLLEEAADEIERLRNLLESHGPEGHNVTNRQHVDLRLKHEAVVEERDRLRAELDRAREVRRWNVVRTEDELRICEGSHERGDGCHWVEYVPKDRAREEARREALQEVLDYVNGIEGPPPNVSDEASYGMDLAFQTVEKHIRELMASPEPVAGKREAAEATEGN